MAIQNPALFIGTQTHAAEDVRRYFEATMNDRPGIVEDGDFAVTEAATPAMTVQVAGGRAFVAGTEGTYQGIYFAENRGQVSVSISTADASNPRKDLIVIRISDGNYSGTSYQATIEAVAGTASASPSEPSVPANSFVLAVVDVAASASSITNSNITDRRRSQGVYSGNVGGLATSLGGVIPCTSSTRPSSPRTGTTIFEEDSGSAAVYNGSAWRRFAYDDALSIAAPTGMVVMTFSTTAPTGWLLCQGQTITNADTTYPDLWSAAPAAWKSGTSLTLPNMKGRFPVGYDSGDAQWNTMGGTGGAVTKTLSTNEIPQHRHTVSPAHTHDIDHNHSSTYTGYEGEHFHETKTANGSYKPVSGWYYASGSYNGWNYASGTDTSTATRLITDTESDHRHTVDLPNFTGTSGPADYASTQYTSYVGDGDAFQILPPFIITNFIIKT